MAALFKTVTISAFKTSTISGRAALNKNGSTAPTAAPLLLRRGWRLESRQRVLTRARGINL